MNRWNSESHQARMNGRVVTFAPFAALTGYEDAIKDTAQHNADSYEVNKE